MFRGSSFHTIDSKGRVIIPTRFREVIGVENGHDVMVSKWDGCLYAYTVEGWSKLEARILSESETSDIMRRFKRFFIGGSSACTCDKQGRILIPPPLRQYAKLEKEIALVGVLNHFEIWSREILESEDLQMEEDRKREEVSAEIATLGL